MDEREVQGIALWEDLLIWASLYGLAEAIAKQLEQFYPRYIGQGQISYADIYLMSLLTRSFSSGHQSGVSATAGGGGGVR
ncbi:hypothetical protein ACS127_06785 [Amphibacillus sp. Q70]|uniref:hypothetical protein n=1 Tax=Amphibacillus sp. Q70 TaxID=3453416 RepID=UPI003F8284E1